MIVLLNENAVRPSQTNCRRNRKNKLWSSDLWGPSQDILIDRLCAFCVKTHNSHCIWGANCIIMKNSWAHEQRGNALRMTQQGIILDWSRIVPVREVREVRRMRRVRAQMSRALRVENVRFPFKNSFSSLAAIGCRFYRVWVGRRKGDWGNISNICSLNILQF